VNVTKLTQCNRLLLCVLVAAFAAPTHAQNLNARAFPLGQPLPNKSVELVQLQPSRSPAPTQVRLRDVFAQPTLVTYVLPSDRVSRNAAKDAVRAAADLDNVQVVLLMRAMSNGELQNGLQWLQQEKITVPVILDRSLELAMGFGATKVPNFAIVDGNGRLMVRRVSSLRKTLQNGKTLQATLSAVNGGGAVPRSDGEQVMNTKSLLGEPAPALKLKPASFQEKLESREIPAGKREKPTLVVAWLATCPHCQREMPRIMSWWRKHKDSVDLVTVTRLDNRRYRQRTEQYLQERNLEDMPVYDGAGVFDAIRVEGVPAWLMVGTDGKVVAAQTGEDPQIGQHLSKGLAKAR